MRSGQLARGQRRLPLFQLGLRLTSPRPRRYLLNVKFNILNKQIYNMFPFPWCAPRRRPALGVVGLKKQLGSESRC